MDASNPLTPWLNALPEWLPQEGVGLIALALVLFLLAMGWYVLRRRTGDHADYDVRDDRFSPTAPINEEQIALLHYFQAAFPEMAVLFRPRLARFLAVRKTRERAAAQARLADEQIDFLICSDSGQPLFAFEVDAFKAKDDPTLARSAAEKNQMLKTAGIRLIRLKGAQTHWPPPEVLRERMLGAQQTPTAEARPSGYGPSEFAGSSFGGSGFSNSRTAPSTVMGLSTLMGGAPDASPWSDVRKRS